MNQELSPSIAFFRLVTVYYVSRAIHVVAELGIADLLSQGPRGCDELASATGTAERLVDLIAAGDPWVEEIRGASRE